MTRLWGYLHVFSRSKLHYIFTRADTHKLQRASSIYKYWVSTRSRASTSIHTLILQTQTRGIYMYLHAEFTDHISRMCIGTQNFATLSRGIYMYLHQEFTNTTRGICVHSNAEFCDTNSRNLHVFTPEIYHRQLAEFAFIYTRNLPSSTRGICMYLHAEFCNTTLGMHMYLHSAYYTGTYTTIAKCYVHLNTEFTDTDSRNLHTSIYTPNSCTYAAPEQCSFRVCVV